VPAYEYACDNGHHFEVIQRMTDDPVEFCEICGAPVHRVLFAPAIHFKGTGFHNTDYASRRRGSRDGDGDGKAEGEKTDGTKTDGAKAGGASENGKAVKEATPKDTAARATGP